MTELSRKPEFADPLMLLQIAAVLVLALAVRLVYASGVVFDESALIAYRAWQFADTPGISQVARWLLSPPYSESAAVFATGLSYMLFGVSQLSSLLPGLLASLGLLGLAFGLTSAWFGRTQGLIAAFLLAIFPLEIFVSTSLLPASLLLCLKVLAIYLSQLARKRNIRSLYILSFVILLLGALSDWIIFAPAIILLSMQHFVRSDNYFTWLQQLAIIALVVFVFIPDAIVSALALYDSVLLILDNLIYLPLLFFGLVGASRDAKVPAVRLVFVWIALEVACLVLAAPVIRLSPTFQMLGVSAYWIQVLIPGLILSGSTFGGLIGQSAAHKAVMLASVAAFFIVLLRVTDAGATVQRTLDVVNRVGFGLAFLSMWLFIFLMNSKKWLVSLSFAVFLFTFAVGSLMVMKTYVASYAYLKDGVVQAVDYVDTQMAESKLVVAGDALFARTSYLVLASESRYSLTLNLLGQDESLLPGYFVLVEEGYLQYVFGLKPDNWLLVSEFGNPDYSQLLVYRVE